MSFFVGGAWIDAPKGSLVIAPGGTALLARNREGVAVACLYCAEAGRRHSGANDSFAPSKSPRHFRPRPDVASGLLSRHLAPFARRRA
jgi:hypothetical protein